MQYRQELKDKSEQLPVWCIVQNHSSHDFSGSFSSQMTPGTGCAGAAAYIPVSESKIKKRVSDRCQYGPTSIRSGDRHSEQNLPMKCSL